MNHVDNLCYTTGTMSLGGRRQRRLGSSSTAELSLISLAGLSTSSPLHSAVCMKWKKPNLVNQILKPADLLENVWKKMWFFRPFPKSLLIVTGIRIFIWLHKCHESENFQRMKKDFQMKLRLELLLPFKQNQKTSIWKSSPLLTVVIAVNIIIVTSWSRLPL